MSNLERVVAGTRREELVIGLNIFGQVKDDTVRFFAQAKRFNALRKRCQADRK